MKFEDGWLRTREQCVCVFYTNYWFKDKALQTNQMVENLVLSNILAFKYYTMKSRNKLAS